MTTLFFEDYPKARDAFNKTVDALGDNPMIAKVRRAYGAEEITFRDGDHLAFRVSRDPVIDTALIEGRVHADEGGE